MKELNENSLRSIVQESGNSDVDVNIQVDIETKSIAYAMLCAMYAKNELTENELERAIERLDSLIDRDRQKTKNRSQKHTVNFDSRESGRENKFIQFPVNERRRSWL